ncbi:hypothetical protein J2Z70_004909 [Paenibacillus silagei]|uniref:Uncharacterized protein n=1 Tax=Paenibacillus silagei TaxID=1670801 RepID=A0ABS4NZ32_9BACL|nr:hypothetical protein [Paenibacillus silagei]
MWKTTYNVQLQGLAGQMYVENNIQCATAGGIGANVCGKPNAVGSSGGEGAEASGILFPHLIILHVLQNCIKRNIACCVKIWKVLKSG